MFKASEQRQFCVSVRPKRSQSAPIQQNENQGKQYRTLLSIFTQNLNSIVKLHRNCLGDIDVQPKIKASREEHQSIAQQLEKVYLKMEDKVMKDVLNRNSLAKKSIQDFAQLYKAAFPEQKKIKDQMFETRLIDVVEQLSKDYFTQQRQSTMNSTPKRPQSSKETRNGRISLINQAYQTTQTNNLSQTYKIKTIIAHAHQNPENRKETNSLTSNHLKLNRMSSRGKKLTLNNKNRYEDVPVVKGKNYQQFLFNGEQIMINERRMKENPSEYDSQSQNSPYSRRHSTKRMINLKFAQRKSINEVQKMQIQNRIMMINSVLSVNLVQPQGYRPKTRCWQNYFN